MKTQTLKENTDTNPRPNLSQVALDQSGIKHKLVPPKKKAEKVRAKPTDQNANINKDIKKNHKQIQKDKKPSQLHEAKNAALKTVVNQENVQVEIRPNLSNKGLQKIIPKKEPLKGTRKSMEKVSNESLGRNLLKEHKKQNEEKHKIDLKEIRESPMKEDKASQDVCIKVQECQKTDGMKCEKVLEKSQNAKKCEIKQIVEEKDPKKTEKKASHKESRRIEDKTIKTTKKCLEKKGTEEMCKSTVNEKCKIEVKKQMKEVQKQLLSLGLQDGKKFLRHVETQEKFGGDLCENKKECCEDKTSVKDCKKKCQETLKVEGIGMSTRSQRKQSSSRIEANKSELKKCQQKKCQQKKCDETKKCAEDKKKCEQKKQCDEEKNCKEEVKCEENRRPEQCKKETKVPGFLKPTKSSQNKNIIENKSAIIDLKSSKIEQEPMSKSQVRKGESHKRSNAGLPLKELNEKKN